MANILKTDVRNTQNINEKLSSLEVDLQSKADTIEMERLQRRIENIEKEY